jgi:hypothetical protein
LAAALAHDSRRVRVLMLRLAGSGFVRRAELRSFLGKLSKSIPDGVISGLISYVDTDGAHPASHALSRRSLRRAAHACMPLPSTVARPPPAATAPPPLSRAAVWAVPRVARRHEDALAAGIYENDGRGVPRGRRLSAQPSLIGRARGRCCRRRLRWRVLGR